MTLKILHNSRKKEKTDLVQCSYIDHCTRYHCACYKEHHRR